MLKIKILSIGKTKEEWLNLALNEYLKRLKTTVSIEFCLVKTDAQLIDLVQEEKVVICLDPEGKKVTSEAFAEYLQKKLIDGGSKIAMVIGGAHGLPEALKTHSNKISLSDLTMTHQIVRLVLVEQIYRAFEIIKGSNYHK